MRRQPAQAEVYSVGAPQKASALNEVLHEFSTATLFAERKRGDVGIYFRLRVRIAIKNPDTPLSSDLPHVH